ncbi:hypothetical protein ANCDUO_11850 [Ancylostoma duodenale]|uniref:Uncharacterized protein n=1 Tax=Ancylostoma duodenale TaxID=51022 RepID=A0A0C2D776_9BILA|nr:hypothetical protein ANCDUO_11850 [Ancylostoma duodenale]
MQVLKLRPEDEGSATVLANSITSPVHTRKPSGAWHGVSCSACLQHYGGRPVDPSCDDHSALLQGLPHPPPDDLARHDLASWLDSTSVCRNMDHG